jgi:hypothetical protein
MINKLLATTIVLAMGGGTLWANGLPAAGGSITASCMVIGSNSTISRSFVGNIASGMCDLSFSYPEGSDGAGTDTVIVHALSSYSGPGFVDVLSGASNSGGYSMIAKYSGEASLNYWVELIQTAAPPKNVTTIPVSIQTAGEVNTNGVADGAAYGRFDFQYLPINSVTLVNVTPNVADSVFLDASCSGQISYADGQAPSSFCQVVADPRFTLDQAAFDAQMGSNTFPLDQYYEFAYSPGAAATPEPSSLALMVLGLIGVTLAVRKATA